MNNAYTQSLQLAPSPTIKAMDLNRQLASSPTIKAMETARRQFAASQTLKAIEGLNRQLASSPTLKAMESLNRQIASSPTLKAIDGLSRQLASSPTLKAIESLNRQIASSPTLKAIDGLSRQLASSPTLKAIDGLSRQLASSPTLKAIESMNRQLASISIPNSKILAVPVGNVIRPPRVAHPSIVVRRSSTTRDLESGITVSGDVRRENLRQFDDLVTDEDLCRTCRRYFANGHYAVAVEKAFVCLDNTVKAKSGLHDVDGAALMRTAFSANSPKLYLNSFESQSDRDEQRGYMEIYAGTMMGIRNLRAHEHDFEDDPQDALELMVVANHLMRKLNSSTRDEPQSGNSAK